MNDLDWLPIDELDTTGWPILEVAIADGPSGFAYGRIRLDAIDQMSFIVEGEGVVATLRPRTTPPEFVCG